MAILQRVAARGRVSPTVHATRLSRTRTDSGSAGCPYAGACGRTGQAGAGLSGADLDLSEPPRRRTELPAGLPLRVRAELCNLQRLCGSGVRAGAQQTVPHRLRLLTRIAVRRWPLHRRLRTGVLLRVGALPRRPAMPASRRSAGPLRPAMSDRVRL